MRSTVHARKLPAKELVGSGTLSDIEIFEHQKRLALVRTEADGLRYANAFRVDDFGQPRRLGLEHAEACRVVALHEIAPAATFQHLGGVDAAAPYAGTAFRPEDLAAGRGDGVRDGVVQGHA